MVEKGKIRKRQGDNQSTTERSGAGTLSESGNENQPRVKAEEESNSSTPNTTGYGVKRKTANTPLKTKTNSRSLWAAIVSKGKYALLLIVIPPFLNFASLQREHTELKPTGELYDVGWGQKLFLSCQGQGPPTVVLDAPTGMNSDVWTLVVTKLAAHVNVCVYDRAGLGFSSRPMNRSGTQDDVSSQMNQWNQFTVERMVDDLHKLISTSSQQPRPLILVGAELGALVAQFYSLLFESDVLGLVLINPLDEELFQQADDAWIQHWFGSLSPTYQTLQLGAALGITRLGLLLGALKQPITGESVPEEVVIRQKYLMCNPRHLSSVVDEHHFINETFSQIRTLRKIKSLAPHISLSVLTGNYYDEQMPSLLNKAWARAEQRLLSKLPASAQHLVINGADRHMLYRKPEPIVETILKIVKRWKKQSISSSKIA